MIPGYGQHTLPANSMRSGLYLLALVAGASAGAAPLSFKNVNLTAPEGFLTGIDVSNYQGQIDWASVATTGISFAMCVVWEGGRVVSFLPPTPLFACRRDGCDPRPLRLGDQPYTQAHLFFFCGRVGARCVGGLVAGTCAVGWRGSFCETGHKA